MASPSVSIEVFNPGPYQTNCMLVRELSSGECWIVDAGFLPRGMIERVRWLNTTPRALILTHGHIDHIAGVAEVKRAFPAMPIWVHEAERDWLTDAELNLSAFAGAPVTGPVPDRLLREGETLALGASRWEVRHTPGHSPGSISLICEDANIAIVGDALFAGSIGRTDFPGCSFEQLEKSIRSRLYTLPAAVTIYPGHGPTSTIGAERASNPFVRPPAGC